jgi:cation transport ATPase
MAEVYFDSVTMFVFFLLGGRYLEMIARQCRPVAWPQFPGLSAEAARWSR